MSQTRLTIIPDLTWPGVFDLWRNDKRKPPVFSPSLLSADLGVTRTMANQWKRRSFIPIDYWPRLITALAARFGISVSLEQLAAMRIAARAKQKDAA